MPKMVLHQLLPKPGKGHGRFQATIPHPPQPEDLLQVPTPPPHSLPPTHCLTRTCYHTIHFSSCCAQILGQRPWRTSTKPQEQAANTHVAGTRQTTLPSLPSWPKLMLMCAQLRLTRQGRGNRWLSHRWPRPALNLSSWS